jgi:NAD+ synthetase
LVAAIVSPVLSEINVDLIGMSLPGSTNAECEIERADKIGNAFCHTFYTKKIDVVFDDVNNFLGKGSTPVSRGNTKAKLRMIQLYDVAGNNGGLVLSTDNKTELMLGFWTLHGDVGDFGPVQQLWKTEVYELSRYIVGQLAMDGKTLKAVALGEAIKAMATDGNGVTDTGDLGQIGADTWDEVDNVLKSIIAGDEIKEDNKIYQRYIATEYKRNNPFNVNPRHLIDATPEEIESVKKYFKDIEAIGPDFAYGPSLTERERQVIKIYMEATRV